VARRRVSRRLEPGCNKQSPEESSKEKEEAKEGRQSKTEEGSRRKAANNQKLCANLP
jgi:hypothetical protein